MIFILGFLVLVLHFFILSKLQFTAWPELLSYPYLINNGFTLYKDFIMPYPPGLILYLALTFKFLGFSAESLKYSFFFLVLLTDCVFFTALYMKKKSLLVIFFFLIYILLQPFLDGNLLWFDYATTLPILAGYVCLCLWIDKKKGSYILIGSIFLSIAVLIKQISIIYFAGFFIFYFLERKKIYLKELYLLGLGTFPLVFFLIYLVVFSSLNFFWMWSIYYPLFEWSKFPGYLILHITQSQLTILLLLFSPLTFIILNKKTLFDKKFILSLVFLLSSIIAIYPRFSFFHFQTVLIFLLIIYLQIAINLRLKYKLIFLAFLIFLLVSEIRLLLPYSQWGGIRFFGSYEKGLAAEISKITKPNDRIFLMGPPSSIYPESRRLPPLNWADNFGWYLEIPGVQEWAIEGFKKIPPKYIFYQKPQPGNWFDLGTYKPKRMIEYMKSNYNYAGNLDEDIEIWQRK